MKKWFHVFFKNRWGRGQPDDIGAMNLGDEKFDPDSDKKPRAGQILWIRGLTRLQTQVTIPISFSLFLSKSRTLFLYSILSIYLCLSIYLYLISLISHRSRSIFSSPFSRTEKEKKENYIIHRHRSSGFGARPHELLFNFNFQDSLSLFLSLSLSLSLYLSFSFFFFIFNRTRATTRRSSTSNVCARPQLYYISPSPDTNYIINPDPLL